MRFFMSAQKAELCGFFGRLVLFSRQPFAIGVAVQLLTHVSAQASKASAFRRGSLAGKTNGFIQIVGRYSE